MKIENFGKIKADWNTYMASSSTKYPPAYRVRYAVVDTESHPVRPIQYKLGFIDASVIVIEYSGRDVWTLKYWKPLQYGLGVDCNYTSYLHTPLIRDKQAFIELGLSLLQAYEQKRTIHTNSYSNS